MSPFSCLSAESVSFLKQVLRVRGMRKLMDGSIYVAIAGPHKSGKSSLVKSLFGFDTKLIDSKNEQLFCVKLQIITLHTLLVRRARNFNDITCNVVVLKLRNNGSVLTDDQQVLTEKFFYKIIGC